MLKLALCAPASNYVHCTPSPWSLVAGVRCYAQTPVDCRVVEHTVNAPDARLLERIYRLSPDVVGLGCYIWNREALGRIIPALRRILPKAFLVLGGPEVSFCPRETLDALPEVDCVLCGEAEEALPRLLDGLARGERPPSIVKAPPLTAPPPSPWSPEALAALDGRISYLESSRGCPFSCAFCLSGRREGVRFFDLEQTKAVLLRLARSGSPVVKLVDRTFNCDPRRALAIWEFLVTARERGEIPPSVCFHFEIAADLLDAPALDLLRSAPPGLFQLEAGLQSFHPQTLEAVSRVTDLRRLEQNLRALMEGGSLHLHVDLIAGLPGEGLEEFARSFNRAFGLRPHTLQLGFLKLLHGSRLRAEAGLHGIVFDPAPPYEVLSTRWLDYGELLLLKSGEDALERLWNSGKFRGTVEYALRSAGLTPFAFFTGMGQRAGRGGGLSLAAYAGLLWDYCLGLEGVEAESLRDAMALDCLATDNTGHFPPVLHRPTPGLRGELRRLASQSPYAAMGWPQAAAAGRLHGALLLGGARPRLAVADARVPHPVTGRYPVTLLEPMDFRLPL